MHHVQRAENAWKKRNCVGRREHIVVPLVCVDCMVKNPFGTWDLGLGTWDLGLRLVIEQKKREVSIKTIFVTPKLIN
jgi:hypothetical protein